MRLIATESGSVSALFPVEEMRPIHGLHLPTAVNAITRKYNFAFPPDLSQSWEKVHENGLEFREGVYVGDKQPVNITSLRIYNDGLIVEASITEDAELFIHGFLEWAGAALALRELRQPPRMIFQSVVIIEFETDVNQLLSGFKVLSHAFGSALANLYDMDAPVQLARIDFGCDRQALPPLAAAIANFSIERRLNRPYDEQRFYCAGPVRTNELLSLLEKVEAAAAPRRQVTE